MKYAAIVAFASGLAFATPLAAWAADAAHPYAHVDRKVDAGNNTGDSMVPTLNAQQVKLDGIGAVAAARSAPAAGGPAQSY